MIVSSSITIGQITFILRVAIQILAYGGLALIGRLILGNAPRVAPIDTHDVINRIVGASSATPSTAKWIFGRLRRNPSDPSPPTNLLIILFLSISYAVFVSLSDVGFLGFYTCSVPGPNTLNSPASVNSDEGARNLTLLNMVNGTNPTNVKAYRCNSAQLINFGDNVSENNCTEWRNSTYADRSLFDNINSTDSDLLMPRQLSHHNYPKAATFDLNSYYIGPNTKRVNAPTIQNGLAVDPQETGMRAVLGVPQLKANHKVDIDKTMALEVDVGCMTLGVNVVHDIDASGIGIDIFQTNGTWRKYTGPEYMRDVLTRTVDEVREYYQPFLNTSTLDSAGTMVGINGTNFVLSSAAAVRTWRMPTVGFGGTSPDIFAIGNCTEALKEKLKIPIVKNLATEGDMCNFLGIGGSIMLNGTALTGFSRMVCASAAQVNMVSATIAMDAQEKVSINVTRLPSDLNFLEADWWDVTYSGNDTIYNEFSPYHRYTLSDNPNGPTTHFIRHRRILLSDNHLGPGSAGYAISTMGHLVLGPNGAFTDVDYAGLGLLEQGFEQIDITTNAVSRWVGQVAASYVFSSMGYNGWAARSSAPILVRSTGGVAGTCYKGPYALGFFPLVFSAAVVACWAVFMILGSSFFGSGPLKKAYGGLGPYVGAICPGAPPKEVLLAWESTPRPGLHIVSKGSPVVGAPDGTALKYMKSSHWYP